MEKYRQELIESWVERHTDAVHEDRQKAEAEAVYTRTRRVQKEASLLPVSRKQIQVPLAQNQKSEAIQIQKQEESNPNEGKKQKAVRAGHNILVGKKLRMMEMSMEAANIRIAMIVPVEKAERVTTMIDSALDRLSPPLRTLLTRRLGLRPNRLHIHQL
jgi:hypothetical protein